MCFCLSKGRLCVSVSTHIHVYNHLQCGLKRFDLKGKIRQFFVFFFLMVTNVGEKMRCREHA